MPKIIVALIAIFMLSTFGLSAQRCEFWSEPDSISDAQSDNYDTYFSRIRIGNEYQYKVFWVRFLEVFGTEIVYADYYAPENQGSVLLAEGYNVSNPQVISMADWFYPASDTLAFIFFEANMGESTDIYYCIMTASGFSVPVPFADSPADETHLRVSNDGSLVWEENGAIKLCQLGKSEPGFYFSPVLTLDEGNCHNPDLNKGGTTCVAYEKGDTEAPEVWTCMWDYANQDWGEPQLLYNDGMHTNLKFSRGMEDFGIWSQVILTDYQDSTGKFRFSYYDVYEPWEVISDFSQDHPMDPQLFTIDLITDFWGGGFMALNLDEGMGNSDIYSSDNLEVTTYFEGYCQIDSTPQSEAHPQLFMGPWIGNSFDLICIWESWRNGHTQLFTSRIPVVVGSVAESQGKNPLRTKLYPVPCRDFFRLVIEDGQKEPVMLHIYDLQGREVKTMSAVLPAEARSVQVPVHDLPPGMYTLEIESGNITDIQKLIIQR